MNYEITSFDQVEKQVWWCSNDDVTKHYIAMRYEAWVTGLTTS